MSIRRVPAVILSLALAWPLLAASSARADDVAGPGKFDLRFGPSFGISDFAANQFRLELEPGIRVARVGHRSCAEHPRAGCAAANIYAVLPIDFGFGDGVTVITILPGVQVDIRLLPGIPLYVYPKFGLGLGIFTGGGTLTTFGIRFGFGVKYVLDKTWNFSFEPFNLEFHPVGVDNSTPGLYNLMFGIGANF